MDKNDLVMVRDYNDKDKNFVYSTFLRGLYYGDFWYGSMPKDVFMTEYHKVLDLILTKTSVKVKMAALKEDDETILGYSIYEDDILHFIFVKKAWRGIGIGRSLVPDTISKTTHLTKVGLSIKNKKEWIFNPFLI